jgi:uncharacterized Fe-S radical SAM superfamily protein PflX
MPRLTHNRQAGSATMFILHCNIFCGVCQNLRKFAMLYQLYETQRSLMEPFSDLAHAAAKAYGNPVNLLGQNPFSQRMSAGYDLLHRLGKDYVKPEFGLR